MAKYPNRIFSGDYSKDMWNHINDAKSIKDLQDALYFVCCRLQNLEEKLGLLFEEHDKKSIDQIAENIANAIEQIIKRYN